MQMYSLKSGRYGILITDDGETRSFRLTHDCTYFSDDIVMDPIRLYNDKRQGFYKAPTTAFEKAVESLASQGYSVFEKHGKRSGKRYGFATIITENDTELD